MLKYKKLCENAKQPTKSGPNEAGYDLYALEDITVPSIIAYNGNFKENIKASKIKTGIALEIPAGYVGLIWDRSSLGSKLIKVFGGVIDSSYRGDITVCLGNFSLFEYKIKAGDRVAQILIQKVEDLELEEHDVLSESSRGESGFGSTGV